MCVPFPHTALISRPREQEVHMNFNGLDTVLGELWCCLQGRHPATPHVCFSQMASLTDNMMCILLHLRSPCKEVKT